MRKSGDYSPKVDFFLEQGGGGGLCGPFWRSMKELMTDAQSSFRVVSIVWWLLIYCVVVLLN